MAESQPEPASVSAPPAAEKERKFPCKGCGAELLYAPGKSVLECPYCGHKETIPQTAEEIKEYSFNDYLAKPRSHGYGHEAGQRRTIRCGGCGAVTQVDATIRSTVCTFCATPIVLDDAPAGAAGDDDVITPEALVPFAITAAQAQDLFKKWIRSRWFAPGRLKTETNLRQLQGVYRPYWTYDSHTVSHWTGERGDYYYTTESYTTTENGKTVTRTRQVRHTRWTPVSGIHADFFDDVLIFAGNKTDHPTTYRLGELKHYAPDFLSGLTAERYVVSCEDGWQQAKEVIEEHIHEDVEGEIGGDEQRVHSIDTAYRGVTYKHILLPLWLSCYRYGNKNYTFQVNGQTGDVSGHRPYSFWKIFLLALSIIGVIIVIGLLAQK
jgi:hypothetical protein